VVLADRRRPPIKRIDQTSADPAASRRTHWTERIRRRLVGFGAVKRSY
jgi:hypothetical protein